ncbi:glycosyltransferase family 4 protein [Vibrio sp. JC009]|uniref:glycosyltransferase family 4 protein n=1 Tax=Vibrio sp. JC009 TaxID=2912314 RepID=UPI0023AE879E|nr:glycosyltransferase family 4 protein [Vibrio sp. JC009]WED21988.1 glycosyltransferase family 4 protein [Vibrio sp. JC009]
MSKKAVLHICLSKGWGGLEMYPIRTGKEFIKHGYKVFGLCVAGTRVASGMDEAGLETYQVKSKNHLIAFELLKLNRWLKQNNVEVIHCHKSGDILVSALLNLLTSRRVLFTEHMGVTRPKKDIYHKWVYSHVDQVLSISNETLKRNIKALPVPENKIERLWLGTDIPEQPITDQAHIAEVKESLDIPESAKIIGTIGRICRGKGQLELIRAFELIASDFKDLHLLIVGGLNESEGADADYTRELTAAASASKHNNRIHLAGFQKDITAMYSVMDIVCLPYYNEAFGLTAIEAMAEKKAIVAAKTGALPEILGEHALFCDPKSSESIANAIAEYLNKPELISRNSESARIRAENEFSMQKHIEKLAAKLTDLEYSKSE